MNYKKITRRWGGGYFYISTNSIFSVTIFIVIVYVITVHLIVCVCIYIYIYRNICKFHHMLYHFDSLV